MHHQILAVTRSYMNEVLAQPFCDPDDPGQPVSCITVCPAPEVSRDLYDNVCDYNALNDVGVWDRNNAAVSGMDNFTVAITVTGSPLDALGPGASQTPGTEVLRIDVTVTHGSTPPYIP